MARTLGGNDHEVKEPMSLFPYICFYQLNIIFTNLGKRFLGGEQYDTVSHNNIKTTSLAYCDGSTRIIIDFIGQACKVIYSNQSW
ncbi:hypothetical protein BX666DRAFT_1940050 [Dichotomocladium elegans]|nr:hypothetical protein BX666DRAFT_1940050 [Dichotomocladium elegans]